MTALSFLLKKKVRAHPASPFLFIQPSTDIPQHRQRQRPAPVEQDPSGSSGDSSDAYEHERPSKQKRTVKRRTDDRDGRQTQKKRKRKQITEEDLIDLPPEKGPFSPLSHRPVRTHLLSQQTSSRNAVRRHP